MIDYLFEKHNCFKTCYCEGRTSNDGIELYNAYESVDRAGCYDYIQTEQFINILACKILTEC